MMMLVFCKKSPQKFVGKISHRYITQKVDILK